MFDKEHLRIEKGLNINDLSDFNNEYISYNSSSIIVYFDNKILGYYSTIILDDYDCIAIDYSLLNSMQSKGLGKNFLETIVEIVSEENKEIRNILLLIRHDNVKSKNIAIKTNFNVAYDLIEEIDEEMKGYIPFIKQNDYYKNKKLCLQK